MGVGGVFVQRERGFIGVVGKTADPDRLTALFGIPFMPSVPKSTQQVIAFTPLP